MIVLYDLAGADGRRFSPYCWRARMALAHKQLACRTVATRFADIPSIGDGKQKIVPVIEDGARMVADSWNIANYLEDQYPDRPSLFGGPAGHALTLFIQSWVVDVLHRAIIELILRDIYDQLDEGDKNYFRATREKRFGRTLEDVQAGRATRVAELRKILQPLRQVLGLQKWFGGDAPMYADYIVFGAFQWPRVASSFPLLTEDDPISAWFERCLDLFEGLGRLAPRSP
jgi:glutathione S-transferase